MRAVIALLGMVALHGVTLGTLSMVAGWIA